MSSTTVQAQEPQTPLVSCVSDTQTPVPTFSIPKPQKTVVTETIGVHSNPIIGTPAETTAATTTSKIDPCITEIALPGDHPLGLTFGPDGNLWFSANENHIDRMLAHPPYTVTQIPVPLSSPLLVDMTPGPDGNMWFTDYFGHIGRVLTKEPNTVTVFAIPDGGDAQQIVAGPDGALWFTEYSANRVGRISAYPPYKIEQFTVPTTVTPDYGTSSGPTGITLGPDNNIWFVEQLGGKIGRVLTYGKHELTEFPVTTSVTTPDTAANGGLAWLYSIVSVPKDGTLWFTEIVGNSIGRIEAFGDNKITLFPLEDPSQASDITLGPDGDLWFNVNGPDYRSNNGAALGHIMSKAPNTIFEYYDVEAHGTGLTSGIHHDRSIWFDNGNYIGRIEVPCGKDEDCDDHRGFVSR